MHSKASAMGAGAEEARPTRSIGAGEVGADVASVAPHGPSQSAPIIVQNPAAIAIGMRRPHTRTVAIATTAPLPRLMSLRLAPVRPRCLRTSLSSYPPRVRKERETVRL